MLSKFSQYSIKAIALFEGGKGLFALISVSLFIFIFHSDAHALAVVLVEKLHVNPDSNFAHKVLMLATDVSKGRLMMISACGYLYSAIKMAECYGLWLKREWGRTLGILSVGVLIPFELYEIFNLYSHTKLAILLMNIAIVVILFFGFGKQKHQA